MAITKKQRILAAGRKQPVDELPMGLQIDDWYDYHKWHGTLPEKYRGWNVSDILRDQGAGIRARPMRSFVHEYRNVEVVTHEEERDRTIYTTRELRTPKGIVSSTTMSSPVQGPLSTQMIEVLFKSADDYPAIEYLLENTVIVPCFDKGFKKSSEVGGFGGGITSYDTCFKKREEVGDDGIVFCSGGGAPMHTVMFYIMNVERFFYELNDNTSKVEHLYELQSEIAWKELEMLVETPVEILSVGENWVDHIHTPLMRKYIIPWLQKAVEFAHSKGKLTRVHIDGEMRKLMPLFPETWVDIAESFTPAPMTSVTTAELRKAWGDKVTVWGGVPAILFQPQYSDEEFDDYVKNLFKEIAPGYNFIVGMGDNLPAPDGKIERVGRLVELIHKYGRLPIEPNRL